MGEDVFLIENYINEIANALKKNHAALMVGAGFSKNAYKMSNTDQDFLDWTALTDKLYKCLTEDNDNKYRDSMKIAQEFEAVYGSPKLEEMLKACIPDLDYGPSQLHIDLLELPWVDVFTTNYDSLLERSSKQLKKNKYQIVLTQSDLINSATTHRIIKLHGSFDSVRPYIITEEDYRTYPSKFAAMVNTVRQSLIENIFCMIGFSANDPNFLSWIGWIRDNLSKENSNKIYLITVNSPSFSELKLMENYNINLVDLNKIYPSDDYYSKLKKFLEKINEKLEKDDCDKVSFEKVEFHEPLHNLKNITNYLKEENKKLKKRLFIHLSEKLSLLYHGWLD